MCRKPSKPHQLPATSSNTFFQQLIKQISVEFACANHCHQGTKASAWQMHAIPTHFADCIVGQVVHSPHILLAGGNSLSHSFRLLLRLQYLYDVQQKTNLYIRISFGDMHENIGPRCGTKVIRSSGKAWVAQGGNHLFGSPEAFLFVTPWTTTLWDLGPVPGCKADWRDLRNHLLSSATMILFAVSQSASKSIYSYVTCPHMQTGFKRSVGLLFVTTTNYTTR